MTKTGTFLFWPLLTWLFNTACKKFFFYTVSCDSDNVNAMWNWWRTLCVVLLCVWFTVVDCMQVPVLHFEFVLKQNNTGPRMLSAADLPWYTNEAKTSRIQALPSCTVDLTWSQKPAWKTCLSNRKQSSDGNHDISLEDYGGVYDL